MNTETFRGGKSKSETSRVLSYINKGLCFSGIFGLIPFNCKDGHYEVSILYVIVNIVRLVLTFASNLADDYDAEMLNSLETVSLTITSYGSLFGLTFSFVWILYYRKFFNSAIGKFQLIEAALTFNGVSFMPLKYLYIDTVVNTLLSLLGITTTIMGNANIDIFYICGTLAYFGTILSEATTTAFFANLVKIMTFQFKQMNFHLKSSRKSAQASLIRAFIRSQSTLQSAAKDLDQVFSPVLLLSVLYTFSRTVLGVYITVLQQNPWGNALATTKFSVLLYALLCVPFIRLAASVNELQKRAEAFDRTVYSLMIFDETNSLATNLKLVHYFSGRRKISFTAFKLFDVDFTVLGKMVATGITYLIIVVQLDK